MIHGLYAAGECACISVHGANRLGCNSLVDLVVFGRRAGKSINRDLEKLDLSDIPKAADEPSKSRIDTVKNRQKGEKANAIRLAMQELMTTHCSVYRNDRDLESAISELRDLKKRYSEITIEDRGSGFNTDLLEALELESLLGLAETILVSAAARTESRGAHYREDFPERDDENWLKHTLIKKTDGEPNISYKPVTITQFQPKARTY